MKTFRVDFWRLDDYIGLRNGGIDMSMATLEAEVLKLSESERARLAGILLHSLPAPVELDDSDDGLEEAIRRQAEMDADPSVCLTWEEFNASLEK